MDQVHDIIAHVSNTLADIAQSDVVVGTPVEVGKVTVVPISRIMAGFGGAGGEGTGDMPRGEHARKGRPEGSGKGKGGGSGGGAVVRPVAVAIFTEEGVDVLPIGEKQGKLGRLLDQVPDLIERFHKSEGK